MTKLMYKKDKVLNYNPVNTEKFPELNNAFLDRIEEVQCSDGFLWKQCGDGLNKETYVEYFQVEKEKLTL